MDHILLDQVSNGCLYLMFFVQVKVRGRTMCNATKMVQVFRTVDIIAAGAYQVDQIARLFKAQGHLIAHIIQHPHHTDCWRRIYWTIFALVVEAHITTGYRCMELVTGITHTPDRIHKLVVHFRIVRVAKVEAVGHTHGYTTTAHNVTGSFAYRDHCTYI